NTGLYLLAFGAYSLFLGSKNQILEILHIGLIQTLASFPLVTYHTSWYLFSLPLGILFFSACLKFFPLLAKPLGLAERLSEKIKAILETHINIYSLVGGIAGITLVFHQIRMVGLSHIHLFSLAAHGAMAILLAFWFQNLRLSFFSYTAFALAFLAALKLYPLDIPLLPDHDYRWHILHLSLYSLGLMVVAFLMERIPWQTMQEYGSQPAHISSYVFGIVAVFMGLGIRFAEVFLPNLIIMPSSTVLALQGGILFLLFLPLSLSLFKIPESEKNFLLSILKYLSYKVQLFGFVLACLEGVDGITSGWHPVILTAFLLAISFLALLVVQRMAYPLTKEEEFWKVVYTYATSLFWGAGLLSLFLNPPFFMEPHSLKIYCYLLAGLFAFILFLWTSQKEGFLCWELFSLLILWELLPRFGWLRKEELFIGTSLLVGLFLLIARTWKGVDKKERLLFWHGKNGWDGAVLFGQVYLLFHLGGNLFTTLPILFGSKNPLEINQYSNRIDLWPFYLASLLMIGLELSFWIRRRAHFLMTAAVLFIGATWYPLLSNQLGLARPALEYPLVFILLYLAGFLAPASTEEEEKSWNELLAYGSLCFMGFTLIVLKLPFHHILVFSSLYLWAFFLLLISDRMKSMGFVLVSAWVFLFAHYSLASHILKPHSLSMAEKLPYFAILTIINSLSYSYLLPLLRKKKKKNKAVSKSYLSALQLFLWLAFLEIGGAILILPQGSSKGLSCLVTLATLTFLGFQSYLGMIKSGGVDKGISFVAILSLGYYFLFAKTVYFQPFALFAPYGLLAIGIIFLELSFTSKLPKDLASFFGEVSFYYPLFAFFLLPMKASQGYWGGLLITASIYYGQFWFRKKQTGALFLGTLLFNGGLFFFWKAMGFLEFYVLGVPLGFSLILVVSLTGEELKKEEKEFYQNLGIWIIFLSTALQVFSTANPAYALVFSMLSFCGILVGRFQKWQSLTKISIAFFVIHVVGFLIKTGVSNGIIVAFTLIGGGFAVFILAYLTQEEKGTSPKDKS
ncbi:MAG: hypothetical protein D6785_03210, partial [Planctomycetota bacterium]